MDPILKKYAKFVCDMSRVCFIGSLGCSLFSSFLKRPQQQGGNLTTTYCATTPVVNLSKLMNLDRLFGLLETREEAVASFR